MQSNDPTASNEMPGQQGETGSAELEALKSRIAELETSNVELRDTVLREKAEIENQRRRLHRDVEQARRFANEKLLNELLPVYDGLERGLQVEGGETFVKSWTDLMSVLDKKSAALARAA